MATSPSISVLKLFLDELHQIRVETSEEMLSSPFFDAYRQALHTIEEIRRHQIEPKKKDYDFNNVIAFTGERGSGKTSVMLSVTGLLEEFRQAILSKTADGSALLQKGECPTLEANGIYVMDPIDPGSFEPADTIVGTMVSRLYSLYKEHLKEEAPGSDAETYRHKTEMLESCFEDVLLNLQTLHMSNHGSFGDPRDSENPFAVLNRLSSSSNLKDNLKSLIRHFLEFASIAPKKKHQVPATGYTCLALPVDDLDLNMEHAFQLAEDIRKYMFLPNLIIPVAMRVEQLREAVEEHYLETVTEKLKYSKPETQAEILKQVEEMANRYLEKIFPSSRCISMPAFSSLEMMRNGGMHLYIGEKKKYEGYEKQHSKDRPEQCPEDILLQKVADCTGLVFIRPKERVHPVIPETLRELSNFVSFLSGLPAPKNEHSKIWCLESFRNYVIEYWLRRVFDRITEQKITTILRQSGETRNKLIVAGLLELYPEFEQHFIPRIHTIDFVATNEQSEYLKIKALQNYPGNISTGDWLSLLHLMSMYDITEKKILYRFAFSTLYSIEVQLALLQDQQEQLQQLIGGAWYNSIIDTVIPRRRIRMEENKELLISIQTFAVQGRALLQKMQPNSNDKDSQAYNETMLWLGHFISFGQQATNKNREEHTAFYALELVKDQGGAIPEHMNWDFLSFLFWCISPREHIKRFSTSDHEDALMKQYESSFGKATDVAFLFQVELIDFIVQHLAEEIEIVNKNKWLGIERSNWGIKEELRALFKAIAQLLDGINISLNDVSIGTLFGEWQFVKWMDTAVVKNSVLDNWLSELTSKSPLNPQRTEQEKESTTVSSSPARSNARGKVNLEQLAKQLSKSIGNTKFGDRTKGRARKIHSNFASWLSRETRQALEVALERASEQPKNIKRRNELAEIAYEACLELMNRK